MVPYVSWTRDIHDPHSDQHYCPSRADMFRMFFIQSHLENLPGKNVVQKQACETDHQNKWTTAPMFMAETICNYTSGHASMQANEYGNYLIGATAPTKTSEVAARVCNDGVYSVLAVRGGLRRMRRVCTSEGQGHERNNKCKLVQLQMGCACADNGKPQRNTQQARHGKMTGAAENGNVSGLTVRLWARLPSKTW